MQAGDGGHGCASIHREKFKPLGGPDGGNGGRGGNVIIEVDPSSATLLDFHRRPLRRAGNGKPGAGSHRSGAVGEDLVPRVPDGTVVKSQDGATLADLIGVGTRFIAAQGGHGGLGNAALASARRKAPGFALAASPASRRPWRSSSRPWRTLACRLPQRGQVLADRRAVGGPAEDRELPVHHPDPHLGVAEAGETQFVVADVPGLIPGASHGKGLGLDFLRHVERCTVLVHVLDCAIEEPGRDPLTDLDVIEQELAAYEAATGADLRDRPRIVALNKIDVPAARERANQVAPVLAARGLTVCAVSAATKEGLRELAFALAGVISAAARRRRRPSRPGWSFARARRRSSVRAGQDRPEQFQRPGREDPAVGQQTDFSNDEAVGYLADRRPSSASRTRSPRRAPCPAPRC